MERDRYKYINLFYVEELADGDAEVLYSLLTMILEELPKETLAIKNGIQNGQFKELRRIIHQFKITLAYLGNEELEKLNLELEQLVKQTCRPDLLKRKFILMERLINLAILELKAEMSLRQ